MLRQGEPEFERLKAELEAVKNAPRGLEGSFRTAADTERHRAHLVDAAIEEQLVLRTAFREHGTLVQVRSSSGPGQGQGALSSWGFSRMQDTR